MDNVKLCKDCRKFSADTPLRQCNDERNAKSRFNYVTGLTETEAIWCNAQYVREQETLCGPEGKWWEPRAEQPKEGHSL